MVEEKIYYDSTDSIKLCGLLSKVNNGNEIIILCHGIRGNKDERNSFINLTKTLQNCDYNSFRFDFRAHGESTGNDYEMTITKEIEDLESTIHMLKQKGFTKFILLGASFGASIISLLDFSKYTNIKGLICWYGALDYKMITDDSFFLEKNKKIAKEKGYYPSMSKTSGKEFKLGLPLFEEVEKITPYENLLDIEMPILFIHGNKDKMVPYELSEKVNSMCKHSKIELIENGDHTFNNSEHALNSAIEKTLDYIKNIFKRGEIKMFVNLSEEQKEEKFLELINYAQKIRNIALKNACINILNDYKEDLFVRGAGHDGIENIKYDRTHQCFDGGLLDHMLNVTKNAYNIGTTYGKKVDMDLILFGAILHDIGKTKIFDKWNEENEIKSNLNYSYLLVDHVYLGEALAEKYLDKENISEKLKYQALHIIATHMDTMKKHMAEAYIVSYADSVDADVENIVSYPRDAMNPVLKTYMYESVNDEK